MNIEQFAINLTSHDPERLNVFYRDVIGLEKNLEMGDHAYAMGGAVLFIDGHESTTGPAKEPQRYLLDFFVADIEAEQSRLVSAGVPFIRDKGREDWGGVISTFEDPDGNYVQLIQYKPA